MFTCTLKVAWERRGAIFSDNRYSRVHKWVFDGGATVAASASPHIVPVPMSDSAAVDPEEAFVAAISSCHMLWFLSIAAGRGLVIDAYDDQPQGHLEKNSRDQLVVTRVDLRPVIQFVGPVIPTPDIVRNIHDEAHERCFIANSVLTEITVEEPSTEPL
jgi:organic hydroperoxide reductase OsmC/OhrA